MRKQNRFCARVLFSLNFRSSYSLTRQKTKRKTEKRNVILEKYPSSQLHTHPTIHFIHNIFTSNRLTQKCQINRVEKRKRFLFITKGTLFLYTYRLIFHEYCNPFFRLRPGDDPILKVDLSMIHWEDPLFLPIEMYKRNMKSIKYLSPFKSVCVYWAHRKTYYHCLCNEQDEKKLFCDYAWPFWKKLCRRHAKEFVLLLMLRYVGFPLCWEFILFQVRKIWLSVSNLNRDNLS